MKKITLITNHSKVPIIIGNNIINKFDLSKYVANKDVLIISNITIGKIYIKQTKGLFKKFNVNTLMLPDGEKYKNKDTLNRIYNFLIKNNFTVYWNYKYNLKKSLSFANEKKINNLIIVGESEKVNNNFCIKNLSNGKQIIVNIDNILDHLK